MYYHGTDEQYVDINVSGKTLKLEEDSFSLSTGILPENAIQDVTWTSSNKKIATVDENGVVHRVKNGTVTFTAKAKDGSGKKASVKVQFVTFVKGLEIDGPTEVGLKKNITLKAILHPVNPTTKTVTWTSSDPSVAKVSTKGVVTGVKVGTATITATAKDRNIVLNTFEVTVKPLSTGVAIKYNGGNISKQTTEVKDTSVQLTAETTPNDAIQRVTWKSSNTKIAKVDANGLVTKVKNGTVTITATAADGSGKKTTATLKFVNP